MKRFFHSLVAIVLVQLALAVPAQAANDYLLQIGAIKGESTLVGFEDQISASSWSWGLSNPSVSSGTGGGSGKPTFSDFVWRQGLDQSVVALFTGVATGQAFSDAKLSVVRTSGSKPASFFEMIFTDVRLTSLSMSGSGSEAATGSLNYRTLQMRYRPTDSKGALGAWISGTFNTRTNSAADFFSGDPNVIMGLFESGGSVSVDAFPVSSVPEPMTSAMLLAGFAAVAALSQRRLKGRAAKVREPLLAA